MPGSLVPVFNRVGGRAVNTGLVLVDVQQDFFERPDLAPPPSRLIERLSSLLDGARRSGWPILHVRTCVQPDGKGRMPHWVDKNVLACVPGTAGYEPPPALVALPGEPVLHKRFFSGFDCPELLPKLKAAQVETLVVAGLYTHGCIRATVLDAYAQGFRVLVAEDAVGSTEPMHAELSRAWLEDRAAQFLGVEELLGEEAAAAPRFDVSTVSAACADAAANRWAATDPSARAVMLYRWADLLEQEQDALIGLLADEIAKPRADAADEVLRTLAHIRVAADSLLAPPETPPAPGVCVRHRPVGTLALITPWNNPLAIPAGKLAPALAWGNTCVWKPAPEAPRCAERLCQALLAAGLPEGAVKRVAGGARVAREIVKNPHISAVSLTGASATGASLAALCTLHGKPLQAELGGNNAALILDDWAMDQAGLASLARSMFGFAGQRCTAVRRLIVQRGILPRFIEAFAATVQSLRLGDPHDPATEVGPLISSAHRRLLAARLGAALDLGAQVVAQAKLPTHDGPWAGRWFAPTLLTDVDPASPLAQEETFGPIALILPAEDLVEAIALANGVPQGLVSVLCSQDPAACAYFAERAQAGMLKLSAGPLAIAAEAPFCGWKASALGSPEHGRWDRDFYTRLQVLYP